MAEDRVWQWLKPYFPRGKVLRVENGDCDPGTPDVHYRILKKSGWIELKDAQRPKAKVPFPDLDRGLHRSQLDWISEYIAYGGLVWIAARVGKEIYWIHGVHAPAFNGATLRRIQFMSSMVMTQGHNPNVDLKKFKSILEGNK